MNSGRLRLFSTLFVLLACASAQAQVREYWIAADEIDWDYAPSYPVNRMSGKPFTEDQEVFVGDGAPGSDDRIGRVYRKSVFRAYTPNFKSRVKRGPAEEHLGIIGPVLRAEVGDTIVVHFRNNTGMPTSMHPHGVFYDKKSVGAMYRDGTSTAEKKDDHVPPGGNYTYTWEVHERSGPGPADVSSVVWPYHGHVNSPAQTNAGLIGMIIITGKGLARADGSPKDVDREFITLFNVFDENVSPHLQHNIGHYTDSPVQTDDDGFVESNLMHGMNGLLWGNNTGYVMKKDEHVRWHVIGMGTEVDIHTPHWHGVTLLQDGHRLDTTEVFPATTRTLDLRADNVGTWMYHCHVNDHINAGMMTMFTILPADSSH